MKVVWSDRALRSLAAIHTHIAVDSETRAHQVIDRILKRGDQLSEFPLSGRSVPHSRRPNLRELIEQPYRIVYRVRRDQVDVIDVFHSARRPPSG
jgi:addiction module RelE/StbE family toxin